MKRPILLLFFILLFLQSFSQSEKYSRIKILTNNEGLKKLMQLGIPVEDGYFDKDKYFITELSETEISKVRNAGFAYNILIDDVVKFYQQRFKTGPKTKLKDKSVNCFNSSEYSTPANFSLGSMGGFFTLQEILDELDVMATLYPNLITAKTPADTTKTFEGRAIYYVKISDNPNVNESEPQVLYTALTHAREGSGMQQLFFFMWYLLENYSTNTDIKNLVDNTELYFVPCANPDGYVTNETSNPSGGGMWRKNRRDNGDGSFGVDINRNFGYNWGYDDLGSSPVGSDGTYRGTAAFSEVESQIIRNFCNSHHFNIALNQHAYGNDMIYPWGFIGSYYTPDSMEYREYGNLLTSGNYFINGTCNEALNYITNGSSDDWMYGEQSEKPKIFALTPESGTAIDGFWPQEYRIPEICSGNLTMNLTAAKLAGKFAIVEDISSVYVSQKQNYFKFQIERLGATSTPAFTVSLTPVSSNIISSGSSIVFNNLNLIEKRTDSILYTLDPSILCGDQIKFVVSVFNGTYNINDTIVKYFGPSKTIFSDDCSDLGSWNASSWGVTDEYYVSAPYSITDSPYSDYLANQLNIIETKNPIDLTNYSSAYITFKTKWIIEADLDYAQIKIFTTTNSTPNILCSKYSKFGFSDQAWGEPLYDGNKKNWDEEFISLDDYAGQKVYLQFSLMASNSLNYDGFYFDDLKVVALYDSAYGIPSYSQQDIYLSDPVPNPATNESVVFYKSPAPIDNAVFEITDMEGKIVYRKNINSTNGSIKISSLLPNKGVYLYSVSTETFRSKVKKIIITEN
jgi:carboxypeptidase T